MKILLKNVSNKPFHFEMTKNPVTRGDQFSFRDESVLTPKGDTQPDVLKKAMRKNSALKDKLSERVELTIEPGETVEFGNKKLNLEQAEYVYAIFGGYSEKYSNGPMIDFPIIEVNDKGEEVRDNLFAKYRAKKSINVMQPAPSGQQFNMPAEK